MSGLMRPWQVAVLLIVASAASAAGGFWLGFREAWTLSAAADLMPRAARSVKHLEAIHAGNLRPVVLGLEFDVDNALVWGYEVMNHPLRELWQPLWAIDVYPGYERYLGELADYRLGHPSSTRADMFASAPEGRPDLQDALRDFSRNAREVAARRDAMVRRYATHRSQK
jgi:hypothetical protein